MLTTLLNKGVCNSTNIYDLLIYLKLSIILKQNQLIFEICLVQGCGGEMTTPSGTIHSPNYPNMYNHDDDCGWLITVDMNHVVELTFSDFDLEHQTNCRYLADSALILDSVNNSW